MNAALSGWTVFAWTRERLPSDGALDADSALGALADARIERVDPGPAFEDEHLAVDWLRERAADHARSLIPTQGLFAPRTSVVLVFAGAPPPGGEARTVGDLHDYLASMACVGFACVEPQPRARGLPRLVLATLALVALATFGVLALNRGAETPGSPAKVGSTSGEKVPTPKPRPKSEGKASSSAEQRTPTDGTFSIEGDASVSDTTGPDVTAATTPPTPTASVPEPAK